MQPNSKSDSNWPLRVSGILFALFLGNVLLGKLAIVMDWSFQGMGEVAEFLTLFGAAALFVVAVLIKEAAHDAASSDQP